ncbi:MAG: Uncharacterized protein XD76_0263 [candidate division TA06 bacterium 32_111]|uniref:Uncharacterized protein n=2 Tax=Bacteria candidate phyla TaxID=1783234 RepID=A0A101I3H7_UNCT6|nr:MAG: Uncharacterized protein XD76_0263 [candidate division TA06 bacterium 32_111]KUK87704.1 MAG: Uncharacterized protein XE03_0595 [candidate division TA06 bacterium 34_109]HAF07542.1 hypothetical protein [candidate division WOR-3 bacterium]HCP17611.1 hypothetical protein [candidate division WOR-3 bacterium]
MEEAKTILKNGEKKEELEKVKVVPTEIYSRVVGYFRPVNNWNEGKREEFKDRKEFKV